MSGESKKTIRIELISMKSLKRLKKIIKECVTRKLKCNPPPSPAVILKVFGSPSDSKMVSYIFFQYMEFWFNAVVEYLQKTLSKSKNIASAKKLEKLKDIIEDEKSEKFKLLTIMEKKENQTFLYDTLNLYNNTKKLTDELTNLFSEITECSKLVKIPPPMILKNFHIN